MKSIFQKSIISLAIAFSAQQSIAKDMWLHRCSEASASVGANYTMGDGQAQAVRKWLIRCEERFISDLTENQFMYRNVNGETQRLRLYPVLGKKSVVPDASVDTGFRVEYSNPKNYQVDVEGVTANPAAAPCNVPADYEIIAYCGAGCFTPDQQLWFGQGDLAIGMAEKQQLNQIVSLTADSTLEAVDYQVSNLTPAMYIQSEKEKKEEVVTLMTNDKAVTVTKNHPMLMSSGEMKQAGDVIVGDQLVNVDGQPEEVMAIEEKEFFGKVLNIQTDEEAIQSHIVAAQGLLTGDFLIQNMNLKNANRFLMRNSLFPVELLQNN